MAPDSAGATCCVRMLAHKKHHAPVARKGDYCNHEGWRRISLSWLYTSLMTFKQTPSLQRILATYLFRGFTFFFFFLLILSCTALAPILWDLVISFAGIQNERISVKVPFCVLFLSFFSFYSFVFSVDPWIPKLDRSTSVPRKRALEKALALSAHINQIVSSREEKATVFRISC